MKIVIDIPKEFESHFEFDRFADSLARVASDIEAFGFKMSGRYERETITMIRKAFENATPLPKGHGRLIDADKFESEHLGKVARFVDDAPTIIEADTDDIKMPTQKEELLCDIMSIAIGKLARKRREKSMITLELDELYGMDSWDDLMDAIKDLKEYGWSDSEIQEVLDRSKTKKEGAEE